MVRLEVQRRCSLFSELMCGQLQTQVEKKYGNSGLFCVGCCHCIWLYFGRRRRENVVVVVGLRVSIVDNGVVKCVSGMKCWVLALFSLCQQNNDISR